MPDVGRAELRFGVLGTVTAWRGTSQVVGGTGRRQLVLAALLFHRDRVVDRAEIIDIVWTGRPPRSAVNLVQKYVGELRRALGLDEHSLGVVGGGYVLRTPAGGVDSEVFVDLVRQGRAALAGGDLATAHRHVRAAIALWRGVPYAGLDAPAMVAERTRLEEYRTDASELLVEVALAAGDNTTAIAELSGLIAAHPFHERLRELQMLALYRSGRQSDALAVYHDVRRTLADELGTDPRPALAQLQERILAGSPDLLAAPVRFPVPACQLPPDVPDFTGRAAVLADLVQDPAPVRVVVGGPGVGKSALALRAGHAVRHRFPGGQLYADLAGSSATLRQPTDILAELLGGLGITGAAVPGDLHGRAALYRAALADRAVLLVFDDAASAAQLRPLLPPTGPSALLVTSRFRLPGLVGARHVELDVLEPVEAREMLTRIVGAGRVEDSPEDAAAVLRYCDHLPLAIRIAGAKLAARPSWPLRVLRDRLADESRRLAELRVGDLDVAASIARTVRLLPPTAVDAFRLLGTWGPEPWLGKALGRDDVLDLLVDANLVCALAPDAAGQPRYRLRDLVRLYAASLAGELVGQR